MPSRHRIAAIAGGACVLTALAGLVVASTPVASANRLSAGTTAQAPTRAPGIIGQRPPLGRPKPSGLKPDLAPAGTSATSPWTPLVNPPPFGTPGTMLLESDGTVLVHNEPDNNTTGGTTDWWKLTPDASGSYIDGTWSQVAPMPAGYTPLYFASAILPDGRMIVEGGEYIGENAAWSSRGAIYNPVTNAWASVAPPPGWTNIGDAASDVLPDGTFMLQQACQTCLMNPDLTVDDALLNARTLRWTVIQATGKDDPNDEEGWTLEPSGQLLTLDLWAPGETQLYNPRTHSWSFAGTTAANGSPLDPWPVVEIGPQAEMPGGNTFVVGAGSSLQEAPTACTTDADTQTALYVYQRGTAGTWVAGPQIPPIGGEEYDSTDGPASTLPDGNVLFDVSACVYNTPTHFFLYNAGSSTLTQVPDVPNAPNDTSFATRLLTLPNGQVLFDDGSGQMEVYTAGGTPSSSWQPSITSLTSRTLAPGRSYGLSGTQLAGLDQGSAYGDDAQDNTNFPLVRITNNATGVVTYARTSNWTSVSVAPGTRSSTRFTLPPGTPAGKSTLVVVANGIASPPSPVTIN
ncbi:MAG TPA: hypothetical protein VMG38_21250 [Trebonia sp.]|nr:hypothetical protein [Trebonia sp.]